jgi:hypothetical protein
MKLYSLGLKKRWNWVVASFNQIIQIENVLIVGTNGELKIEEI